MEEQLISFECAVLAKSKGFKSPSSSRYIQMSKDEYELYSYEAYTDLDEAIGIGDNLIIIVPTQSLLQRWLREKHSIKVFANYWEFSASKENGYYFHTGNTNEYITGFSATYEEALEKGLIKALNLINI